MKGHERRMASVIRGVLEPLGFDCETVMGGKHAAVVATRGGLKARFPISGTPRDADCQLVQARQQVLHWLDEQGVGSGRGQPGTRRPRKARRTRSIIHRFEVAIDPTTGPARDPWAALRGLVPANDDAEEIAA